MFFHLLNWIFLPQKTNRHVFSELVYNWKRKFSRFLSEVIICFCSTEWNLCVWVNGIWPKGSNYYYQYKEVGINKYFYFNVKLFMIRKGCSFVNINFVPSFIDFLFNFFVSLFVSFFLSVFLCFFVSFFQSFFLIAHGGRSWFPR